MTSGTRRIPWWEPQLTGGEAELIQRVLDANFLNEGDFTTSFEREIAELVGCRHVVAATSGTIALFLSLKGLGVGPGDEVIVPDITFIASANAVDLCGATTVLADVEPTGATLDPQAMERAVTSKTKAVMPVHVTGRGADMEAILEIARMRGLFVVEDAAEALTSRRNDRCLGTFGDAGCLSFSPNKTITTGQGGAILTDDPELHVRLRELKDQGRPVRGTGGNDLHNTVGYNFKFTNLQAAVGLGQLPQLASRVDRIKRTRSIYVEELAGVSQVRLLPFRAEETPQWVDAQVEHRDALAAYLKSHGVGCREFWFPIHRQRPYQKPDRQFPVSSKLSYELLWLPSAFTLVDEEVRFACGKIKEFYRRPRS